MMITDRAQLGRGCELFRIYGETETMQLDWRFRVTRYDEVITVGPLYL